MNPGDLVWVKQTIGCHTPPKYLDRGIGVVLNIDRSKPVMFRGLGEVYMGDDVTVHLGTGEVKIFNEKSVKVINESW